MRRWWRHLQTSLYIALAWFVFPKPTYERYRDNLRQVDATIDLCEVNLKRISKANSN